MRVKLECCRFNSWLCHIKHLVFEFWGVDQKLISKLIIVLQESNSEETFCIFQSVGLFQMMSAPNTIILGILIHPRMPIEDLKEGVEASDTLTQKAFTFGEDIIHNRNLTTAKL